jgi:hypothetical protein
MPAKATDALFSRPPATSPARAADPHPRPRPRARLPLGPLFLPRRPFPLKGWQASTVNWTVRGRAGIPARSLHASKFPAPRAHQATANRRFT